jgi:hypothetical protein
MRCKILLALSLGSSLVVSAAVAAEATPERAKQIGDELSVYLGRSAVETGALVVTPTGDDYRIDVNLDRAAAAHAVPGLNLKASWSVIATPNLDGTWHLRSDSMSPMSLRLPMSDGEQSIEVVPEGYHYDAIFDPRLGALISSSATIARLATSGKNPSSTSSAEIKGLAMETSATAPGDGLLSMKLRDAEETSTNTFGTPAGTPSTVPAFAFVLNRGASVLNGSIDSLRNRAILDLWAFLVAHPALEELKPVQDELRSKLRALLPLWNGIDMAGTAQDFAVDATGTSLKAKTLGLGIKASGISGQSAYAFVMNLDDIDVYSVLLPAWIKPFLPTLLSQSIKVSNLDMDAVSRYAIDNFDLDLETGFTSEQQAKIDALILNGKPTFSFGPSHIKAPAYDVTLTGTALLNPPRANIAVEAKNFEDTIAAVQSAAEANPSLASLVTSLTLAQGLSRKSANGFAMWDIDIEFGDHQSVTVNGQILQSTPK